jgi:two-component system, NarL family, sensor histidine kinase UhpB
VPSRLFQPLVRIGEGSWHAGWPRSLIGRLLVANTALWVAVFLILAFSPLAVKSPLRPVEGGLYSLVGLALVTGVNALVIGGTLAPLRRLRDAMRRVDPLRPGERVDTSTRGDEVAELAATFNEMLRRLEDERRQSVRRTLRAQEAERLEVARDLHDEIGQRLTALMLQLDYLSAESPAAFGADVAEARENARGTLEEVRRLAKSLRPEVLDELGLPSALRELSSRFAARSGIAVDARLESGLPDLDPETELVIYRIAQESLTNVVRHSRASRVRLDLQRAPDGIRLSVTDDGRGVNQQPEGAGMKGMRERAVLIGADLSFRQAEHGGVEVRLQVPA